MTDVTIIEEVSGEVVVNVTTSPPVVINEATSNPVVTVHVPALQGPEGPVGATTTGGQR